MKKKGIPNLIITTESENQKIDYVDFLEVNSKRCAKCEFYDIQSNLLCHLCRQIQKQQAILDLEVTLKDNSFCQQSNTDRVTLRQYI